MASSLLERQLQTRTSQAQLCVEREDISFLNVAPDRVQLSIVVSNTGPERSQPTTMTLQAAPLGAFVAWRDLTSIVVPPIEPFGSQEIVTEVTSPRSAETNSQFSSVPPWRMMTAIAAGDAPDRRQTVSPRPWISRMRYALGMRRRTNAQGLPFSTLDILRGPNVHWAGNINVHIGGRAVERHMAHALRIYPGRKNLAMFFVGDRSDDYQFDFSGSGTAWDVMLYDATMNPALSSLDARVPTSTWIRLSRTRMFLLAVSPPADCTSGSINVHVRQRSTESQAIVEFSMDASAAGAGCYTV